MQPHFANPTQALHWLSGSQKHGIKLGLESMRWLDAQLGQPSQKLRCIHIAGTNGKGSTAAFCEAALRALGFRTGLYTSPHLVRFAERIQINRHPIDDTVVTEGLSKLQRIGEAHQVQPSFFELTTALAFWAFVQSHVDWVVLETGLGGRLDATNIVTPEICLITPISHDHGHILGKDLTSIAGEKAGIIKPGVPVISVRQDPAVEEVLSRVANEKKAPLHWSTSPWNNGSLNLAGAHQKTNAALARDALHLLLPDAEASRVAEALRNTTWPGRWDLRGSILLDGAHNPASLKAFRVNWRNHFGSKQAKVMLLGLMKDKDLLACLPYLQQLAETIIVTEAGGERSFPADQLAQALRAHDVASNIVAEPSFDNAWLRITNDASSAVPSSVVLGSLHLVAEVLAKIENTFVDRCEF
ncbi:MAG: bifunctional folylpolyglutamate synthase/dihydrofolate synthase [Verrucomicrobiales bacterium]